MDKVLVHAVLKPETGMFQFEMSCGTKSIKVVMPPDQFLGMAQYLAKVGVSYQEWLKNGGK